MTENLEAKQVIERLGGTTKVALLCEIKSPSVSDWKRAGIPKPWRKFLLCAYPEAFKSEPAHQDKAA